MLSHLQMKYIVVSGGVISGLGIGIVASCLGALLKSCGLHVTLIKVDPYLNSDAATFPPHEHGKSENSDLSCGNLSCYVTDFSSRQGLAFTIHSGPHTPRSFRHRGDTPLSIDYVLG